MINTLEELLQDYASYSLNLGLIDEKQRQALDEKAENYIKQLNQLKLLDIADVVVPKGTLCECGGSERIALDCTMKPCKHPKDFSK